MIHHLYKDFLADRRVYRLNEAYYARLFKTLTNITPVPFYNTRFNNGEKFYDGNPIFSTLSGNRILRIIQEEPDSNNPFIHAWVDKKAENNLEELVVSLELSKETAPHIKQLIQKWMAERVQTSVMEQYISTIC